MGGRQGVQVAFGTEALVTTRVPDFPWPMPPPTQLSSLPSVILGASPSQAGCAVGSGANSGLL